MPLSDDVKAEVGLVSYLGSIGAERLPASRGNDLWFRCPLHGGDSFHVTIAPGKPDRWFCHGCNAGGTVVDLCMLREGRSFAEAVRHLAGVGGVGTRVPSAPERASALERKLYEARAAEARAAEEAEAKRKRAMAIWAQARLASDGAGLILCQYLEARCGRAVTPPRSLRIAPDLRWQAEGASGHGPAMVAAVGRGKLVGVHRTWIAAEGRARMAGGAKVPKMTLGPIWGHPVRLTPADPDSVLIVGEGIETTLAVLAALRDDPARLAHLAPLSELAARLPVTAEAALSLGALAGPERRDTIPTPAPSCPRTGRPIPSTRHDADSARPGWLPPADHRGPVVILADPSAKSPAIAEAHALRAQAKLVTRRPDLDVALAVPRGHFDHACDFADLAAGGEL